MSGVLLVGEALVDFLGEGGASLEEAERFRPLPGGAAANAAVAAARAGAPTAFAGRVGDDAFGRRLRVALETAGVDCAPLCVDPAVHTTLAFVMPGQEGPHGFAFVRGADARLAPQDLPAALFRGRAAVGAGGVSLSALPAREATLEALSLAREHGALAVFDVNWRVALWPSAAEARAAFREALALADVVKCNEEELELLVPEAPDLRARAEALLATGGPVAVAVTRGAQGALWVGARGAVEAPGFPVPVVDAIGAGDCFLGTLLAWWAEVHRPGASARGTVEALPPETVAGLLRRCNAAAALSTQRPGAMGAMPRREEVDRFLAAHPA